MKTASRFAPLILLAGDLIALTAFVAVGQRDHNLVNAANPVLGVLATAAEFGAPWAAAGWLLGAFRVGDREGRPDIALLARSLNAWLVAAPIGILIRSYALGRAVIPTVFLVATLGFGGLFVLGWRVAFALVWGWVGRNANLFAGGYPQARRGAHVQHPAAERARKNDEDGRRIPHPGGDGENVGDGAD
jgi:hypothetical protein